MRKTKRKIFKKKQTIYQKKKQKKKNIEEDIN